MVGSRTFCISNIKLLNFINLSKVLMPVWVVDKMCETFLPKSIELLYYDNLIKCNTSPMVKYVVFTQG